MTVRLNHELQPYDFQPIIKSRATSMLVSDVGDGLYWLWDLQPVDYHRWPIRQIESHQHNDSALKNFELSPTSLLKNWEYNQFSL